MYCHFRSEIRPTFEFKSLQKTGMMESLKASESPWNHSCHQYAAIGKRDMHINLEIPVFNNGSHHAIG